LLFGWETWAVAQALEPEEGIWNGVGAPWPYDLVLRQALLGSHPYRLCGMVTVPSFSNESAVYMIRSDAGRFSVVSRRLKEHLWPKLQDELARGSIRPEMDAKTIQEKLRIEVEERTVELDEKTANTVTDVCRNVLLQTRYPQTPRQGLDGVIYHAGHWIPGAFLSGKTWSPEPNSISGRFGGDGRSSTDVRCGCACQPGSR
jgi:hypothetical protein